MIKRFIQKNRILILILTLALFLRFSGIYPGYPDIHPDESSSYATTVHLLYNFFMPDRFDYPAGVPFINAIIYVIFFIPFSILRIITTNLNLDTFISLVLNPHNFFIAHKDAIFGNRDIYAMYWTRYITAAFGVGTVFLLYIVGKKLFNKEVGLFAAFFLAVNYLHVLRSHFGLPDVYNGFFAVLSLYASALILEKNTTKRYLLAGFAAGMGFAIKYQIFALLPFIIVHLILTIKHKNIWYFFHKNAFYAAFVFIATFLVINPYYLLNIDNAIHMNKQDVLRYRMGDLMLRPYPYFYLYYWGIDKLPSIMVVLGVIFMFLKSKLRFALVFPFAFVFMFFMTYYSQGGIFTRNFATVMPYLMLFAGYGTYELFRLFKSKHTDIIKVLIVVFLIWVNSSPIQNSFILDKYYSEAWNETKLGEWLRDKLPKNTIVRNYQLFLHTVGGKAIKDKNIELRDWNYSKGPNSLAEFQQEGDFAILNTNPYQSITYWWRGYPQLYIGKDKVPSDFIQNGFYGLTVKELLNYTVFESYKPWQAHYNDNYIVFKIPEKPKQIGERIVYYSFDNQDQNIAIRGNFSFNPLKFSWTQSEGKKQKGALNVLPGQTVTSRLTLAPIKVEPGKLYTARGFIKNKLTPENKEPEGFLRIDFYGDSDQSTLDRLGISVAISNRAKMSGDWEEVSANAVAPPGAKYATVSFQFKGQQTTSFVDDIEFFEGNALPEEKFKEIPYIKSTIPIESIYYNTFI